MAVYNKSVNFYPLSMTMKASHKNLAVITNLLDQYFIILNGGEKSEVERVNMMSKF